MSEAIPISPDSDKELKERQEGGPENGTAQAGSGLDESILNEIEGRLDGDLGAPPSDIKSGDKVELDKADLPLDWGAMEEAAPPKVEVDLADDADLPDMLDDVGGATEKKEGKPKNKYKLIAIASLFACMAVGAGLGVWFGLFEPSRQKQEVQATPWRMRGEMPDPGQELRYSLEPFLVPLLKAPEGRILHVAVDLEVVEPNGKVLVGNEARRCRDVIYRLLRDRPAVEIKTGRAKKILQAQIKNEINHILKSDVVFKVYFTEFVITG